MIDVKVVMPMNYQKCGHREEGSSLYGKFKSKTLYILGKMGVKSKKLHIHPAGELVRQ